MSTVGIHGGAGGSSSSVEVTSLPNEGQQTMANSISVAIASDQYLRTSSTVAFDALNDTVELDFNEGVRSVGFWIEAGTLDGIIIAQGSVDGTSWIAAPIIIYQPTILSTFSITTTNPSIAFIGTIPVGAPYKRVRFLLAVYNSGSANVRLQAVGTPSPYELTHAATGQAVVASTVCAGLDGGSAARPISIDDSVPTESAYGIYTRPLPVLAATSSVTSVSDTASSTTLLSANVNRLGASITNDSSAALYVKFGTTASTTSYTVRLSQFAYYEVPYNYTGRIDGIWASDPNDGAARITEVSR